MALAWVLTYSLAKRFTWWPHLWLGHEPRHRAGRRLSGGDGALERSGLAAARGRRWRWPPGSPGSTSSTPCPTRASTGTQGLRSAVVRLGERRAILLAKLLHGVTIPALALFGWGAGFGSWYFAGLVVAAGILVYEHQLVRPGDLSRLDAAFFTMNGVMSVTVFAFALMDRLRAMKPQARAPGLRGSAARPRQPRQVATAAAAAAGTPSIRFVLRPPTGGDGDAAIRSSLAITGASGAPYGVRLLDVLARHQVPVWLIVSSHGMRLLRDECGIDDAGRAARGHGRGLALGHELSGRRPRRAAGLGLAADARHGDLSVLDGDGRGHRRRHQPLAGRARRGRDPQGAAEARSWCPARRRSRWCTCATW